MKRRAFIQSSLKGLLVAAAGGSSLVLKGCRGKQDFDLVIKSALVFDGLGSEGKPADVAIKGDSITEIGRIDWRRARGIIDGQGLALAPGFIDIHDHTDVQLLVNPRAESHIHQGITTLLSGNCGSSPFPLAGEALEEEKRNLRDLYNVDLDWTDLEGFFARLEKGPIAINYATLVGHGSLRAAAVGLADRPPSAQELNKMKELLRVGLEAGAFGLSSGLEYTPGSFAQTPEIVELCRLVAGAGGIYATHMRDEGDNLEAALEEALEVGRSSRVKLQISHFKTAYRRNWTKLGHALSLIEKARQEGIEVAIDRYPYIAGSTGLSFFFPLWAREGGTDAFLQRLKDPNLEAQLRAHLKRQEEKLGSWSQVMISSVSRDQNRWLQGMTIADAAMKRGMDDFSFIRDLLINENGQVGMISFMMSEENLKQILSLPYTSIGCDGVTYSPEGILGKTKPHPRSYGSFPRFLGKYVREEKVCSLAEAIRRITSLPASRLGLRDRGIIAPGYKADLVLFDPDRIRDRATWETPHTFAEGIVGVIVNGIPVIDDGHQTQALPGRILRRT